MGKAKERGNETKDISDTHRVKKKKYVKTSKKNQQTYNLLPESFLGFRARFQAHFLRQCFNTTLNAVTQNH